MGRFYAHPHRPRIRSIPQLRSVEDRTKGLHKALFEAGSGVNQFRAQALRLKRATLVPVVGRPPVPEACEIELESGRVLLQIVVFECVLAMKEEQPTASPNTARTASGWASITHSSPTRCTVKTRAPPPSKSVSTLSLPESNRAH
jgi:hypothetical protein